MVEVDEVVGLVGVDGVDKVVWAHKVVGVVGDVRLFKNFQKISNWSPD